MVPIGVLSNQTVCHIEKIRYYERFGILSNPPRTEGGHRLYEKEHIKRLVFVRRSRELGFSLEEIRTLYQKAEDMKSNLRVKEKTQPAPQQKEFTISCHRDSPVGLADFFNSLLGIQER